VGGYTGRWVGVLSHHCCVQRQIDSRRGSATAGGWKELRNSWVYLYTISQTAQPHIATRQPQTTPRGSCLLLAAFSGMIRLDEVAGCTDGVRKDLHDVRERGCAHA
jgi:hypothetical protein